MSVGPVQRASDRASERMAAAVGEQPTPGLVRENVGVEDMFAAFVGLDIDPKEAAYYVRFAVNATFEATGRDTDENTEEWRTAAGQVFRALLVGVLAGRDVAGAMGVGSPVVG